MRNTLAKTIRIIMYSILTTTMLLVSHDDHRETRMETMLSQKVKPHARWDLSQKPLAQIPGITIGLLNSSKLETQPYYYKFETFLRCL